MPSAEVQAIGRSPDAPSATAIPAWSVSVATADRLTTSLASRPSGSDALSSHVSPSAEVQEAARPLRLPTATHRSPIQAAELTRSSGGAGPSIQSIDAGPWRVGVGTASVEVDEPVGLGIEVAD